MTVSLTDPPLPESTPRQRWAALWLSAAWPLGLLLLGLTMTVAVVQALNNSHRDQQQLAFEREAERWQSEIERRLSQPLDLLAGAHGLLAAGTPPTPAALEAYRSARAVTMGTPGLPVLAWAEAETPAGLLTDLRNDLPPARLVHVAGAGSRPLPGRLDLSLQPAVAEALARAARDHQPALTAFLDQGHALLARPGYLLILPVFARDGAPARTAGPGLDTPSGRRLQGWLITGVQPDDALAGIGRSSERPLSAALLDADGSQRAARVAGTGPDGPDGLTVTRTITLGDRSLTLQLAAPAEVHAGGSPWAAAAGVVGTLLSLSSALLVALLIHGHRVIDARARALSHDVDRLAMVAQHTTNAVHLAGPDGRIVWANEAHARLFGSAGQPSVGQLAESLGNRVSPRTLWDRLLAEAADGRGARLRLSLPREAATPLWLDCEIQPLLDAGGWPQGHMLIASDVTDLHLTAEALTVERSQLSMLLDTTQAGVVTLDLRTGRLSVDDAYARQIGLPVSEAESLGERGLLARLHPDSRDWIARESRRLARGETDEVAGTVKTRHADGHWVTSLVRGRASLRDDQGQALLMVSTHVDITSQVQAEERWRSRAELSADWFWETDTEHRMSSVSQPASATPHNVRARLGLRRDEFADAEPPDGGWDAFHAMLDRHESFKGVVYRAATNDGVWRWLEIDGRPRFDDCGRFLGYQGVGRDVQERLEATERLRHSLALVDALFDAVPVPLAVKDAQGRCTRTNRAYAEAIGLPAPDGATDAASAQLHHEVDRQLLASGGRIEYEVTQQLASGRTMDAWISKAALLDPRGTPSGVVEVLLDVTTQRQAARLTEEAKRAAEAANHAKSAFLAAMSHEIRTPMNGVLGMAELLLHGELAPPQRDTAQVLHRSARRLLRILDSILDFSKLEAERLELDEEPVDPAQLVRDGVAAQRGHARQRGVAVTLELDDGLPPRLRADSLRVSQVLGNLLSNAIKFSAPARGGGAVRVSARVDGSHWVFEVADNGIGMSEDTQARLFDPFTQAEASTTRRFGGTGLGLAISKGLVTLMGGDISARSSPGAGSVFTVRLPLVVISDSEHPMLEITAPGVSADATDTTLAELPALPSPQSAWSGRRPRVLVAEDDPTNRVVVERQLALLHCDAVLTDNGLDALRAWREGRFDALITDVQMPGLDGIELAREVRADEARQGRPRMPVLALSANVLDSETTRARSAGIDDYLTKPIALEALRRVLQTWLDPQGRSGRPSASPARTADDALTA